MFPLVTLKCECCGFEEEFESEDAAFEKGWDVKSHLPSWPVSCDLCPGVCAMGLEDHSAAHARWEVEGRPAEFELEPGMLGPVTKEGVQRTLAIAEGLVGKDSASYKGLEEALNKLMEKVGVKE